MKLSTKAKIGRAISIVAVVTLLVAAAISVGRGNYDAAFAWVVAAMWAGITNMTEKSRDELARRYFRAVGFKEDEV